MGWNVGGIRFLAGDVDRCWERQMASGRSTLLRSASLVASFQSIVPAGSLVPMRNVPRSPVS
jgi:hypothetical protein